MQERRRSEFGERAAAARDRPAAVPRCAAPSLVAWGASLQRSIGNRAATQALEHIAYRSGRLLQRAKLTGPALEEAKTYGLRAMASALPVFANARGKESQLRGKVHALLKIKFGVTNWKTQIDMDDVDNVTQHVANYVGNHPVMDYDAVVTSLAAGATPRAASHIQYLRAIADWPILGAGPGLKAPFKPGILFGHTESGGLFARSHHVITLDETLSTDEQIIALTFEVQNARNRERFMDAQRHAASATKEMKDEARIAAVQGLATAAVEYQANKDYIAALKRIYRATDIDALVQVLRIPQQFMQARASYEACKADRQVPMPPRGTGPNELAGEENRQALWWWKTRDWTDEQRQYIWGATAHAPGMAASVATYSQH
jgi:hypothetical protein